MVHAIHVKATWYLASDRASDLPIGKARTLRRTDFPSPSVSLLPLSSRVIIGNRTESWAYVYLQRQLLQQQGGRGR